MSETLGQVLAAQKADVSAETSTLPACPGRNLAGRDQPVLLLVLPSPERPHPCPPCHCKFLFCNELVAVWEDLPFMSRKAQGHRTLVFKKSPMSVPCCQKARLEHG